MVYYLFPMTKQTIKENNYILLDIETQYYDNYNVIDKIIIKAK